MARVIGSGLTHVLSKAATRLSSHVVDITWTLLVNSLDLLVVSHGWLGLLSVLVTGALGQVPKGLNLLG